ncbi:hypothetical protein ACMGDM_02500 [Sphingomonas sp. DT-51]|uniref:hypothetical protein n=1 Tax=Sphingomonas sp. DT-51 TaxID=3396165 RepID=UPI003F19BDA3
MSRISRHLSLGVALPLGAALVALPCTLADAQTTRLIVDGQAGVGYSSNPFLVNDDGAGSAFTELSISPQLVRFDEKGEAALSAYYRRTDYFTRYDSADSYGVEARARRQLTETFNAHAVVSYDSSIIGQSSYGLVGVLDPSLPPDLGTPDIALLGLRQRQKSLTAAIGADLRISQRDTINGEVRASRISYGDSGLLTSSTTKSATLGWSHAVSARTSVGLQGSGSWSNFDRDRTSGSFYQPQVTLTHQFSESVSLSAAVGALFITSRTPLGTTHSTGISGNIFACKAGQRSNICARAYSDAQPTGFGDVSKRQGAGIDYSYQLRENDVLRASADYSRVQETSNLLQARNASFINAGASYEHGFSRRLFGGVAGGYRRATGGGQDWPSDVNVKVFVRARWGDTR